MTKAVKYRKKPVVVEAMRLTRGRTKTVAAWCGGRAIYEPKPSDRNDIYEAVMIPTLEGNARAEIGDYIVRGELGEFYPVKPGIFAETYEKISEVLTMWRDGRERNGN